MGIPGNTAAIVGHTVFGSQPFQLRFQFLAYLRQFRIVRPILHLLRVCLQVKQLPLVEIVEVDQLVALRRHTPVTTHHMRGGPVAVIFVILIIMAFAEGDLFPFQQRFHADALHRLHFGAVHLDPGQVEEGLGVVQIADQLIIHLPRFRHSWPTHNQRRAVTLLIHEAFIEPAMLTEEESLIR